EGDKDDHRHRHGSDLALAPPDIFGIEAADRSAAREQERRAAKDRHAAERDDEWRHLEPRDRLPLEPAAGEADRDRRQSRERPAVAERVLARADREAIRNAPLVDSRRDEAGESEQRTDREIDAR